MQIELRRIIATRHNIEVLEQLSPAPPLDLGVRLARNLRKLKAALQDYDKANADLIKEFGEHEGGRWTIDPNNHEAMEKYAEANMDAMESEVEVDIRPIKASEIREAQAKKENFEVPFQVLVRMDYLFDLEE